MSEFSPGLNLPYLQPSQAQKHVTHNQALQRLDQLVQLRLSDVDALTPPAAPVPGETQALGSSPTGLWAGQGGQLASWDGSGWQFVSPQDGWLAWDLTTGHLRVWSVADSLWLGAAPSQLDQFGIATTADGVNRLAVSAPATLLTHDGGGHQLKINKATDGDTASLLLQSNWTGHAELGLAGDTAFALKLSADGSSWSEVLRADPIAQRIDWAAAGMVQMSLGASALQLDVPLTGLAVQSQASDTTPGRLMRADYGYGPGNLLGPVSQQAGVPTGAVIERGSNANGDYVRFADGTQICTNSAFSTSDSADSIWTYPAAFTYPVSPGRPVVSGAVSTLATVPAFLSIGGIAGSGGLATEVAVRAIDHGTGTRVSASACLMAFGRWT